MASDEYMQGIASYMPPQASMDAGPLMLASAPPFAPDAGAPPPVPAPVATPPSAPTRTFDAQGNTVIAGASVPAPSFIAQPAVPAATDVSLAAPPPAAPNPAAIQTGPQGPQGPGPGGTFTPTVLGVTGGGYSPEHEKDMRAPTATALLDHATQGQVGAVETADQRTQAALQQVEESAKTRALHASIEQSIHEGQAAKDKADADAMATEINTRVDAVAKDKQDPSRWWSSKGAGEKFLTIVGLALSTFGSSITKTENVGMKLIQGQIDADLKAQEFQHQVGLDALKGKQTAYNTFLQQTGSPDGARAMAKAAALRAAAIAAERESLSLKGTDAGNNALKMSADLRAQGDREAASAFKLIQAQRAEAKVMMAVNGVALPFPVSQDAANKLTVEHGVKPRGEMAQEGYKGQIAAQLKDLEGKGKEDEKTEQGAKFIAEKLQTAGIPQARAAADAARTSMQAVPRGYTERVARGTGLVPESVMPEKNTKREGAWRTFVASTINAFTGAGVGVEERKQLTKMLNDAGNDNEREDAIRIVTERLDAGEKNIRAGASLKSQAQYDEQKGAAKTGTETPATNVRAGWNAK